MTAAVVLVFVKLRRLANIIEKIVKSRKQERISLRFAEEFQGAPPNVEKPRDAVYYYPRRR